MDYFKDFTFHWWEFGLMKISLIAFGILIGSYWANIFRGKKLTLLLWVLFVIPAAYLVFAALQQIR